MKLKLMNMIRRVGPLVLAVTIFWRPATAQAGWQLVWSEEFDQADGSAPDRTKWGYDTGGGGWGASDTASVSCKPL